MKRFLLSTICLIVGCAIALCAVNETLVAAQNMLKDANTIEQYEKAKRKFKSAESDPNYDKDKHQADIDKGIKECDARIAQLSATLSVSPSSLSFGADGGASTLSVSTNQGSLSAKSSADWLTVERSSSAITVRCAPNSSAASRSATVTVTAGAKSVQVKARQEAASLVISAVEFGQSDNAGGSQATGWGEPLYAYAVRYVRPRITYSSPARQTKTISAKVYNTSGTAPSGYTHTMDCDLEAGTGTLLGQGYGASAAGSLAPGTYAYELWADGERAYSTTFEIREKFDGIKFDLVEFGSADANGRLLSTFGSSMYKDKACQVKGRIHYKSPKFITKKVYVKAYKQDGSLWTLPDSPAGYTLAEDVTFREGSKMAELGGIGWSTPQFEAGNYRYEVWVDGQLALESSFTIAPAQEGIKITSVEFGAQAQNHSWEIAPGQPLVQSKVLYVAPKISYASPSRQKKDVYFKYYDANGKLIETPNSPKGFTHAETVEFRQGKSSYIGIARGRGGYGKFARGTYKVEIYIDGKCLWSGAFVIQ